MQSSMLSKLCQLMNILFYHLLELSQVHIAAAEAVVGAMYVHATAKLEFVL